MPELPYFRNLRTVPSSLASCLINANRLPSTYEVGMTWPLSSCSFGL